MKQKVSFVCHWTKGLQRKAEFFCIHYYWREKRKSTETIMERCFSCQNKSVCQILARSCKKWKSAKIRYTPFLHEGLQLLYSWTSNCDHLSSTTTSFPPPNSGRSLSLWEIQLIVIIFTGYTCVQTETMHALCCGLIFLVYFFLNQFKFFKPV